MGMLIRSAAAAMRNETRYVVFPWMPGTFEPVDADAVDTEGLGFDRVADAGALVENLDACAVKVRQMGRGRRSQLSSTTFTPQSMITLRYSS